MAAPPEIFAVTAPLWRWKSATAPASWYFITIDPGTAMAIRAEAYDRMGRWKSVKVSAVIGETRWQTSLFPHKESGGFLLPVKATVRKAEGISEGDEVTVSLEV
jgi:hypothetical protein